MPSRTFRLFVSSTFKDFSKERAVLQEEVFLKLKTYCSEKHATFQPIDLRWGVNSEAQLDQKTLELCLSEVYTCNAHPRPNFLIIAGDRYGWVPLPYAIEKEEYETLTSKLQDTSALSAWYELDVNHIPHAYIIKQRSGEFVDYDTRAKVENTLRTLLQDPFDREEYEIFKKIFMPNK